MLELMVGDKVIIDGVTDQYSLTRNGSTGTIIEILASNLPGRKTYKIVFDYLSGDKYNQYVGRSFYIYENFVLHQKDFKPVSRIERKVNQMFKRQPYYKLVIGKDHA